MPERCRTSATRLVGGLKFWIWPHSGAISTFSPNSAAAGPLGKQEVVLVELSHEDILQDNGIAAAEVDGGVNAVVGSDR